LLHLIRDDSTTHRLQGLSHSQVLRQKIALASGGMFEALDRFWQRPDLAARYPELLFHIYSAVRASVPLMQTALRRAEELAPCDPVARGLAEYLAHHIPEELHHDEWLLDDIVALGASREAVVRRLPPTSAAAMVGSLYYWVIHTHPLAFLGYAAVIEGHPPSENYLEDVQRRTGLPAEGFRTYLKHARLDPHHSREMDEVIDRLPLTPDHTSLLGVVAFQTIHHLTALFEGVTAAVIEAKRD
jgi:hypothetical protein